MACKACGGTVLCACAAFLALGDRSCRYCSFILLMACWSTFQSSFALSAIHEIINSTLFVHTQMMKKIVMNYEEENGYVASTSNWDIKQNPVATAKRSSQAYQNRVPLSSLPRRLLLQTQRFQESRTLQWLQSLDPQELRSRFEGPKIWQHWLNLWKKLEINLWNLLWSGFVSSWSRRRHHRQCRHRRH